LRDNGKRKTRKWFLVGAGVACVLVLWYLAASRTMLLPAYFRMPAPPARQPETRDGRWHQDVQYFASQLPRLHVDAFHSVDRQEFECAVAGLDAAIPTLNDFEITLEILRIVAMVGDAHTRAVPPSSMPFHLYPLKLYWLQDGFYVTGATPTYQDAVGARVVQIGGVAIEDVYAAVAPYVAHETDTGLRDDVWLHLLCPEVHRTLGIADGPQAGRYTLEKSDGTRVSLALAAVGGDEYFTIVPETLPAGEPLYLQQRAQFYWFTYLEDARTVYFQYNKGQDMETQSFRGLADELFAFVDAHPVERLVIDVRHNGGGDEGPFWSFVNRLAKHPLNEEGRLYVIVGRGTYSSAVLNAAMLQRKTDATFVGEPPSSTLDHYGQFNTFVLPNSHIRVYCSTAYFTRSLDLGEMAVGDWLGALGYSSRRFPVSDANLRAFVPDVLAEPTIEDYLLGRDPALEAVWAFADEKGRGVSFQQVWEEGGSGR
jgi:hypothetical protein